MIDVAHPDDFGAENRPEAFKMSQYLKKVFNKMFSVHPIGFCLNQKPK
jgi:hypothetical protein